MTGSLSFGPWSAPITLRVALTRALASPPRDIDRRAADRRAGRGARPHGGRVRTHRRVDRTAAEPGGAGDVLPALVGALLLQALAQAARAPAHRGGTGGHGA